MEREQKESKLRSDRVPSKKKNNNKPGRTKKKKKIVQMAVGINRAFLLWLLTVATGCYEFVIKHLCMYILYILCVCCVLCVSCLIYARNVHPHTCTMAPTTIKCAMLFYHDPYSVQSTHINNFTKQIRQTFDLFGWLVRLFAISFVLI